MKAELLYYPYINKKGKENYKISVYIVSPASGERYILFEKYLNAKELNHYKILLENGHLPD